MVLKTRPVKELEEGVVGSRVWTRFGSMVELVTS